MILLFYFLCVKIFKILNQKLKIILIIQHISAEAT
jgi:hypothetical protein